MIGEQTPLSAAEEQLLTGLLREALTDVEPRAAFGPALLERLLRSGGIGMWRQTLLHPWMGAVAILFLLVTAGAGYQYFLNPAERIMPGRPDTEAPMELRTPSPVPKFPPRDESMVETNALPQQEALPTSDVPVPPVATPPPGGTMQLFQQVEDNAAKKPRHEKSLRTLPAVGSGAVESGSGATATGATE